MFSDGEFLAGKGGFILCHRLVSSGHKISLLVRLSIGSPSLSKRDKEGAEDEENWLRDAGIHEVYAPLSLPASVPLGASPQTT